MKRIAISSVLWVAVLGGRAVADDIDARRFEYLDVLETADGSVWKGIVIEQSPGVEYKIASADGSVHVIKAADVVKLTKQRNPQYQTYVRGAADGEGGEGLEARRDAGPSLPPPAAHTGARAGLEVDLITPTGTVGKLYQTSFTPAVRVGYEGVFGNVGLEGGALARFTYWRLPGETADAAWTLETHVYGRAALHVGKVAPYVGVALGLDTNYLYSDADAMSKTSLGLGVNLDFGLAIAATPAVAIDIGGDFHPGTDTLVEGKDLSVEYFAFRVGSAFRF